MNMKELKVITTCESEELFWKEETKTMGPVEDCMHVVNVFPEVTYQTVHGFGGAFTEAAAHNYYLMSKKNQKDIIESYYGDTGLRYNMGRIHMNSCDFALGNYVYIEEGDKELNTFDISHDFKEIIPMVKEAMETSSQEIHILMSPWSPAAFMKTNGEMNHGGKLKKEYYECWANYFVRFIKEYQKAGIKIEYLTVQNEPEATQTWDSCIIQPKKRANLFVITLDLSWRKTALAT